MHNTDYVDKIMSQENNVLKKILYNLITQKQMNSVTDFTL